MFFQVRHELPYVAIQLLQFANGFYHFLNPKVIHRLDVAQLQPLSRFDNLDGMCVSDLPAAIDCIHAMIEFIANARTFVESLDDLSECLVQCAILDFDFRQALNHVQPRSGGVERGENDRGGGLIGIQQKHQEVDEKTLVVRPAEHEIADQCENRRTVIGRLDGNCLDGPEIWHRWEFGRHRWYLRCIG